MPKYSGYTAVHRLIVTDAMDEKAKQTTIEPGTRIEANLLSAQDIKDFEASGAIKKDKEAQEDADARAAAEAAARANEATQTSQQAAAVPGDASSQLGNLNNENSGDEELASQKDNAMKGTTETSTTASGTTRSTSRK